MYTEKHGPGSGSTGESGCPECTVQTFYALAHSWSHSLIQQVFIVYKDSDIKGRKDATVTLTWFLDHWPIFIPTVVTNTGTESHRGERRVYLAYNFRSLSILAGKSQTQELETAGHITPQLQSRSRESNASMQSACLCLSSACLLCPHNASPSLGNGAAPKELDLPTSINNQDTPLRTLPHASCV